MSTKNYILFDDDSKGDLLPFTYTKPISEIRVGILTITQKWEKLLNSKVSFKVESYLSEKFPEIKTADSYYLNGKICPTAQLINEIESLALNTGLKIGNELIAFRGSQLKIDIAIQQSASYAHDLIIIYFPWDIFAKNALAIKQDFELITKNRVSQKLSSTNTLIGSFDDLFIEEGVMVEAAILNTKTGPIYIGKDAEIMEGSVVRGPLALCEHSVLKLATKIYGATTIGPHSKVGGEINNSVIFGYSNKAHDGFLGNSVIGEWCNLGADTNNSNLKNNYAEVKIFNYPKNAMINTGLQFCGLLMGDYSKSGINTMFNTGTVVGVGSNIFGADFPPTHLPSFVWGGAQHIETHQINKFFDTTEKVYSRREITLTKIDKDILTEVFNQTKHFRG